MLSGWQFICLHVDVEKVKAAVMLNFRVAVSWNQGISKLAILSFHCVLWVSDRTRYNPASVAKSVNMAPLRFMYIFTFSNDCVWMDGWMPLHSD